jgi:hypothetical protein
VAKAWVFRLAILRFTLTNMEREVRRKPIRTTKCST